jgi:hypothetical protein
VDLTSASLDREPVALVDSGIGGDDFHGHHSGDRIPLGNKVGPDEPRLEELDRAVRQPAHLELVQHFSIDTVLPLPMIDHELKNRKRCKRGRVKREPRLRVPLGDGRDLCKVP